MKHDASLDPVNREAAFQMAKGVKNLPVNVVTPHWELCPPMKTVKFAAPDHDLTGRKFGRFTVVGFSRDYAKKWVVRCACGDFETRSSKAVKNPANAEDCCTICRKLILTRRAHHYRTHGYDK